MVTGINIGQLNNVAPSLPYFRFHLNLSSSSSRRLLWDWADVSVNNVTPLGILRSEMNLQELVWTPDWCLGAESFGAKSILCRCRMHYYFSGNFSSYSNQSSFLQGYWYWHQMEWLISLFYVLSKCIIWNREMVYFKKKSTLCSNSELSPVLTVNRKLQVITQRHVSFHLCISISDREWVKKRALGKRTALAMISDRNRYVDLFIFQVQFSGEMLNMEFHWK